MQHRLCQLIAFMAAILFTATAVAQKDTLVIVNTRDSFNIYKLNGQAGMDSLHRKIRTEAKIYTYRINKDSLKRFDSLKRVDTKFMRLKQDSVYKRWTVERKKLTVQNKLRSDSAFKKLALGRDSLYKLGRLRNDSGFKRLSLEKERAFKERLQYLKQIRTDSLKMKQLYRFKDSLQFDYAIQQGKKYDTKEVSVSIACKPVTLIIIKNTGRKVTIKKVKGNQVRLSANVNYTGEEKFSDAEWFKKMGVSLQQVDTGIVVMIDDAAAEKSNGSSVNTKRTIQVSVPDNGGLVIDTKNTETQVEDDVSKVTAKVLNGTFKMQNANEATITAKYSTVKAQRLKTASIALVSCKLSAEAIDRLDIDSKNSTVNITNVNTIGMSSVSDMYHLYEVAAINGKKDFGKLYLDHLKERLVLTGANTDVSVTEINANTNLVKVDSKYADLRFPVYDLKNYTIKYEGSSKSVSNVYTTTQKMSGTITMSVNQQPVTAAGGTDSTNIGTGKISQTKFEATAGNTNGKYTAAEIKCAFCNVVFQ